jgi:hypothetical protein
MNTREYGDKLEAIRNGYIESKYEIQHDTGRTSEGKQKSLAALREVTRKDIAKVEAEMFRMAEAMRAEIPAKPHAVAVSAEQDLAERRASEFILSEVLTGNKHTDALARLEAVVNHGTAAEKFGLMRVFPQIQEKLHDKYGTIGPTEQFNPWVKSESTVQDSKKLQAAAEITGKLQSLYPKLREAVKTKNELAHEAARQSVESTINELSNWYSMMSRAVAGDLADLQEVEPDPWKNPIKNEWGKSR